MKKTIIALLALAGVAAADTLTPVASVTDYSVTSSGVVSFSDPTSDWSDFSGKLDAAAGFTLQITLTDWTCANGPLFYLSTAGDDSSNATSLVAIGYTTNNNVTGWGTGATVFNSANGSAVTGRATYSDITGKDLPSHDSLTDGKLPDTVSLFVTGKSGAITLYEVDTSFNLVEIAKTTNVTTGTAQSIVFSQWSNASGKQNGNRATIDIVAYNGVLTTTQMTALAVPEPTTATLSLLALAGLAVRRRRR